MDSCSAFLTKVAHLQFRCCEPKSDKRYSVLEGFMTVQLATARKDINNMLGAEAADTQDPWNHTKGRTSASIRCAHCRR